MKRILYTAVAILLFASCKKEDKHLPPNFNYEIPHVPLTENVNVGAYYHNYAAADWAKKYSDTPTLGEYSALTASVMAQHRAWADKGGVDFFIFNWNGTTAGNPLLTSFLNGRTENVKMVINYNTAHLSATNNSPLTGTKLNTMISELKTLATAHFDKNYYYTINGRPVILITPLNLSSSAGSSINYPTVMATVKQELAAINVDPYIIGEITTGWLPPQRYATSIKAMDAVVLNNWATDVYDRASFFPSYSDMNWKNWKDSTTSWGTVDFVPCVFPGYNDKVMTPASKIYDIERNEKFYTDYSNVARRNMSNKKLVLLNSWNHFQLGTAIEPAVDYGERYLELTKKLFKVN